MQRVEIDYLENANNFWMRARKEMDIAIDRKRDNNKGTSIILTSVSSEMFCRMFDSEPNDINGFDWWGSISHNGVTFSVFGEAWEGKITLTLE